jgi:hypothetical protein
MENNKSVIIAMEKVRRIILFISTASIANRTFLYIKRPALHEKYNYAFYEKMTRSIDTSNVNKLANKTFHSIVIIMRG